MQFYYKSAYCYTIPSAPMVVNMRPVAYTQPWEPEPYWHLQVAIVVWKNTLKGKYCFGQFFALIKANY